MRQFNRTPVHLRVQREGQGEAARDSYAGPRPSDHLRTLSLRWRRRLYGDATSEEAKVIRARLHLSHSPSVHFPLQSFAISRVAFRAPQRNR